MKKLVIKLGCLFLIAAFIVGCYNQVYLKVALYERNPSFSIEKFRDVSDDLDVCCFGNSLSVCAFETMEGIEGTTFNFALSAQSLSYDYRIMQQYKDRIKEGTVVFLVVDYHSFALNDDDDYFDSKNERYYYFLKPEYIKSFSPKEYLFIKTFPVLWHTPITIIQKVQEYNRQKEPEIEVEKDSTYYTESARSLVDLNIVLDANGNLIQCPEAVDALCGMIQLCKEQNARPIVILTPYRKEYCDQYSESFYEQYYRVLKNICDDDCELFDYSHDNRFSLNNTAFGDAYHLSEQGSKSFLEVVKKEILK